MKVFFGELIGTFILVFIGCGSVGWTCYVEELDLWQIALIWGGAVTLSIHLTSKWSGAHLNPAVSIGFLIQKQIKSKLVGAYLSGQFIGAYIAAVLISYLLQSQLDFTEIKTAMVFGEYYPNPLGNNDVSNAFAFFLEFIGTFFLMIGILYIIKLNKEKRKYLIPSFIGLLLAILIYCIAPFTQAGFNPTRDLAPRLFSFQMGFSEAFSINGMGWLSVYVCAPILGAILASYLFKKLTN